ncbi:hypothetical protein RB195_009421 [Necator americanus]|uniref:C2H2-type domain-containing protein n=1 Tax=Necator americanus TaxID=51031 RepID=A0ABR1CV39_NECAM
MLEISEDCDPSWICPSTSSSTISQKPSADHSDTISGWSEIVEFYHASASEPGTSSGHISSRKRSYNEPQPAHTGDIKFSKNINNGCTVTCPICGYPIKSSWPQDSEHTLGKLVKHLLEHEGALDSSRKASCMLCYNFLPKSKLDDHYRDFHGEPPEKYCTTEVFCFTNSVHRYQDLIDRYYQTRNMELSTVQKCSKISEDSLFTGYPTSRSLEKCRAKWRKKFDSTSDTKFLFRFRASRHSRTPLAWICPLCEDSVAFSRCSSFSNDISLRLFTLRHFSSEHKEVEAISAALPQEWEILAREVGFDLEHHVTNSLEQLQQTQRSCHFYTLRSLHRADKDRLICEMVGRTANKEDVSSSEFVVCAVCFNPLRRMSLFRHFSLGEHKELKVHANEGEFREVSEIAEASMMTSENFPYVALRYSKVYRIRELGDSESLTFMKWRCILPCRMSGHVDDVLEFPTVQMLKIHAMKHFQTYHDRLFKEGYLDYEWEILRRELPSSAKARHYSPLTQSFDNEPFDTTNPNHFIVPFKANLLPRSFSDVQICGFCFWCGYSSQFLGHIVCHGYIDIGIALTDRFSKSQFLSLESSNETDDAVDIEIEIPTEILGSVGLELHRHQCESKEDSTALSEAYLNDHTGSDQEPTSSDAPFNSLGVVNNSAESTHSDSKPKRCAADSTTPVGDESDNSSLNDLSICNESRRRISRHPPVENPGSTLAHTCTSGSVSFVDPLRTAPATSNDEAIELDSSVNTDVASSRDVDAHKASILRKFEWEGPPPPPLDAEKTGQLMMLSRNECPFCPAANGSRGLRVPAFANDEIKEESMIAHIVRFHHDDPKTTWVLDMKRYRLSIGEHVNPLKFLLDPSQDGNLLCSSCEKASFPKLSNLRVHWIRCVEVCGRYRKDLRLGRLVLESPTVSTTPKQRSKNPPVKCPLSNCISAWRPSFIYPNSVGQLSHMLARHLVEKQAYDIAVEIGKTERLDKVFPYLDVSKSFTNTLNHPKTLCLQCSKCEHGFRTPNELVQHAKRYHPTDEHYSGAPKCPFSCDKRMQRRFHGMSDGVLRLLHVFKVHLDMQEAVKWIQHWPERFGSIMESEQVYKFDVLKSLESSISTASAMISCLFCKELIPVDNYLKRHRKPGSPCFDETDGAKSGKVLALTARSKALSSRVLPCSTRRDVWKNMPSVRRKMRHCDYCSRGVPLSDKYSDEVSFLLHVVHAHVQNEVAVKWVKSRDYHTYVREFPYIDVIATCDASRERGKPVLHCAICNFTTDTSRRMMHHARLHGELMRNDSNYPDRCCACGNGIPACNQVKESFQRLCHVLTNHVEDENLVRKSVTAYEIDYSAEGGVRILDAQRSLESSNGRRAVFVCASCGLSFLNGYALINHAKIHERHENVEKKRVLERKPPTVCSYCNRMLLCSTRYSPRITLLAHFVKFHRLSQENLKDFAAKCSTWKIVSEFPYIDPVVSINKGKLQCALCEASFPDTSQMLKHAMIVHEANEPSVTNEEIDLEGDLSLHQPENEEDEQPSRTILYSETAREAGSFGGVSKTSETIDASVPITQDKQNSAETSDSKFSADERGTKVSYALRTPKKELKVESIRRESRSYAPSNTRIPQLPSSSDEEANREWCPDHTICDAEASSVTEAQDPELKVGSTISHQTQEDEDDDSSCSLSEGSQSLTQQSCAASALSDSMHPKIIDTQSTSLAVPYTSTPKSEKPNRTSSSTNKTGSILSWLSPVDRSIVPSRRAELILEPNLSTTSGRNIRDALNNACGSLDSTVFKVKPPSHISGEGTLFDELPQRIVQKIAMQSKPPDDISHIVGAKGYPCNFCGFKGRTVNDIRRHTSMSHSKVLPSLSTKIVSPCHLCNEIFEKRTLLLKHITDFHADVPKPFRCAYCSKTYATSQRVREHERRSHESRLFLDAANLVCPHCDKEFDSKRNRDEHVKRHSNPDSTLGRGF